MRPRIVGALLALAAAAALVLPAVRAEAPRPCRAAAAASGGQGRAGPAAAARGLAAQRQLHDRGPARPGERTIAGTLVLEWRNTSDQALSELPVPPLLERVPQQPLDDRARRGPPRPGRPQARGPQLRLDPGQEHAAARRAPRQDLTPTLRYLNEDGNTDDRTVMEVRTARPIAPGASGALPHRVGVARAPRQRSGRAGWVHDYHFVAQWFPKIGVFWKGQWNCHPFYPWTEFFSDFGVYDVTLTLPQGFVVGATGRAAVADRQPRRHRRPTASCRRTSTTSRGPRAAASSSGARASTSRATRRSTSACCCSPSTRTSPSATSRPRRSRCGPTAPGRRPTPTPRSRSSTPPGARPRAGWSTRRSSRAAPPGSRPRSCRAPRASRSTRPATSSGTASSRTTSSRRPGSTRASTPT